MFHHDPLFALLQGVQRVYIWNHLELGLSVTSNELILVLEQVRNNPCKLTHVLLYVAPDQSKIRRPRAAGYGIWTSPIFPHGPTQLLGSVETGCNVPAEPNNCVGQ